jgi:assimilatory nitrate reductase catalytic subunit
MFTTPRFLQGVVEFEGKGLDKPVPLGHSFSYVVPAEAVAQPLYFRGGNSTDEMICVVLVRDGKPMRYFPIGARNSVHVPLRVVEDISAGTHVELQVAAPEGLAGTLVADVGLAEIDL